MSFSGQYATFTPDPELNKREWFNERGGYIIRSRFYPAVHNNNDGVMNINQINQNQNQCQNQNQNHKRDYIERDVGFIEEKRMAYNQPSNFIDFLNYYFKNLLR